MSKFEKIYIVPVRQFYTPDFFRSNSHFLWPIHVKFPEYFKTVQVGRMNNFQAFTQNECFCKIYERLVKNPVFLRWADTMTWKQMSKVKYDLKTYLFLIHFPLHRLIQNRSNYPLWWPVRLKVPVWIKQMRNNTKTWKSHYCKKKQKD